MRYLAALLLVGPLLLAAGGAARADQHVVVTSEVDRSVVTIGDPILLTIIVQLAPGHGLVDPGVPRVVGDLEVVDVLAALQARLPDGSTRVEMRFLVAGFQLGRTAVPVITIGYVGPGGEAGTASTGAPIPIEVRSVIQPGEDTSDIKPLKPPLALPVEGVPLLSRLAPVALAALGLALVVLLLRRLLRRWKRAPAPGVPVLTPALRALAEIERIAGLGLAEQGRVREHYALLAGVLRRYASERTGINADARTARELRWELEANGFERSQAALIAETLRDAESVRFGEHVVYPARARQTMRELGDALRRAAVAEEYELARGPVRA